MKNFESCYKMRYVCTNYDYSVLEHRRCGDKWLSELRNRYGKLIKQTFRTNEDMRHIFNHMRYVAECDFYSLSTDADFSPSSV